MTEDISTQLALHNQTILQTAEILKLVQTSQRESEREHNEFQKQMVDKLHAQTLEVKDLGGRVSFIFKVAALAFIIFPALFSTGLAITKYIASNQIKEYDDVNKKAQDQINQQRSELDNLKERTTILETFHKIDKNDKQN